MLSYAGIPLVVDVDPKLRAWVDAHLHGSAVWAEMPPWPPSRTLPTAGPRRPIPSGPCSVNRLRWPHGATRFGYLLGIATDAQLARIRAEVYAGATNYRARPLVLADGVGRTVTADMYLLPPRPLAQCPGAAGLWLVPLADERWRWWRAAGTVSVTGGTTTWPDLFAAIGAALGVTITADDVPAAYLKPSAALGGSYQPLPVLLDAAAASVGMRVVRTLAGAVRVMSPTTALATRTANRLATATKLTAGGQLALTAGL